MSSLIVGIVLIAAAVAVYVVVLQVTRRGEKAAGLFSDAWVANLHAPMMVGLLTFGTAYVVKFALTVLL